MSGTSGMTLSDDVPVPVRAFVGTTNAGDSDALVALFTPDALLSDSGRQHRGREGVAAWNAADGVGVQAHLELVGVKAGTADQTVVATIVVSGGRSTGTREFEFVLRGDEIARLTIES